MGVIIRLEFKKNPFYKVETGLKAVHEWIYID